MYGQCYSCPVSEKLAKTCRRVKESQYDETNVVFSIEHYRVLYSNYILLN